MGLAWVGRLPVWALHSSPLSSIFLLLSRIGIAFLTASQSKYAYLGICNDYYTQLLFYTRIQTPTVMLRTLYYVNNVINIKTDENINFIINVIGQGFRNIHIILNYIKVDLCTTYLNAIWWAHYKCFKGIIIIFFSWCRVRKIKRFNR